MITDQNQHSHIFQPHHEHVFLLVARLLSVVSYIIQPMCKTQPQQQDTTACSCTSKDSIVVQAITQYIKTYVSSNIKNSPLSTAMTFN